MPSGAAGAIRAGQAYVELSMVSKLNQGLQIARRQISQWGASIRNMGATVAGAGAMVVAPFIKFLGAASEAESILLRFKTVFAELAPAAWKFTEAFAKGIGRSRYEMARQMTNFMAFFKGAGFSSQVALDATKSITRAVYDFAGFNALLDDDAQRRFISALGGSSEVLDLFGVNLKEAQVSMELARLGMAKSSQEASEMQKQVARLSLIFQGLRRQGALNYMLESLGLFRTALIMTKSAWNEFQVAMGAAIFEQAKKVLFIFRDISWTINEWARANQDLIRKLFLFGVALTAAGTAIVSLGISIQVVTFAFGGLLRVMNFLPSLLAGVLSSFAGLFSMMSAFLPLLLTVPITILGIIAAFGQFGKVVETVKWAFTDGIDAAKAFINDVLQTINKIGGAVVRAFSSGQIQLALEILYASFVLVFRKIQAAIMPFLMPLFEIAKDILPRIKLISDAIWSALGIETTGQIANSWTEMWDTIYMRAVTMFYDMQAFIKSVMVYVAADIKETLMGALTDVMLGFLNVAKWVEQMQAKVVGLFSESAAEKLRADIKMLEAEMDKIRNTPDDIRDEANAQVDEIYDQRNKGIEKQKQRLKELQREREIVSKKAAQQAWLAAGRLDELIAKANALPGRQWGFPEQTWDEIKKTLDAMAAEARAAGGGGGVGLGVVGGGAIAVRQAAVGKEIKDIAKNTKKAADVLEGIAGANDRGGGIPLR